jgi:hypothetical protein
MRQPKSDRIKKLEQELNDLEQWLKLGLVPKKDIERHKKEIEEIGNKIKEEQERLLNLKVSGEEEEFSAPKRQPGKAAFTDMPTIPDIDMTESQTISDTAFETEADTETGEQTYGEEERYNKEDESYLEDDDESIFSDRKRWRRGARDIIDPEANDW